MKAVGAIAGGRCDGKDATLLTRGESLRGLGVERGPACAVVAAPELPVARSDAESADVGSEISRAGGATGEGFDDGEIVGVSGIVLTVVVPNETPVRAAIGRDIETAASTDPDLAGELGKDVTRKGADGVEG